MRTTRYPAIEDLPQVSRPHESVTTQPLLIINNQFINNHYVIYEPCVSRVHRLHNTYVLFSHWHLLMPYPMVEPTYTHASHEPCEPEGKVSQELTILNSNSFWHKAFLITYSCQECYTSSMRKAVSGQKMSHGCSRHSVPVPDYEISSWSIEISPLHAHHCLSSGTMSRLQSARGKNASHSCPPHA